MVKVAVSPPDRIGIELAAALALADRVSVFCHENPDADTLAAALAIAWLARSLGKETEVVTDRPIAPGLRFLPGTAFIRHRPQLEPDLAVICDSATLDRIGPIHDSERNWFARARLLNVDHHATNTLFGDVNCVDADAAATCQVIAEALPTLNVVPDLDLATLLLAGIVRDTQGFAEPSSSPRTFRVAATLAEAGASAADLHRRILGELPYAALALWGQILDGLRQRQGGRVVFAILTPEMLAACDAQQHDADGVVELMSRVRGAQLAVLFRELGDGETRVSVRALGGIDAAAIAKLFGGGGHRRRAGCTLPGSLADSVDVILHACEAAVAAETINGP